MAERGTHPRRSGGWGKEGNILQCEHLQGSRGKRCSRGITSPSKERALSYLWMGRVLGARPALEELCLQAVGRVCRGCKHNQREEKLPQPLFIYTRPRLCFPWQAGAPRPVPGANPRCPRALAHTWQSLAPRAGLFSHFGRWPAATAPACTPSAWSWQDSLSALQPCPASQHRAHEAWERPPPSERLPSSQRAVDTPQRPPRSLNYDFVWVWNILPFRKWRCGVISKWLVTAESWWQNLELNSSCPVQVYSASCASCSQKRASLSYQSLRKLLQSPINIRTFNLQMQKNVLSDEGEMEGPARLDRKRCGKDSQHPWEDTKRTSEHQGEKSFLQKCFALHVMLCGGLQSPAKCFIYMGRLLRSSF